MTTAVLVKIKPNAGTNQIKGMRDNTILIEITAPAVKNRANIALQKFLAQQLDIPAYEIQIKRGAGTQIKLLTLPTQHYQRLIKLVNELE